VCRALDKAIQDDPSNGPEFADTSWDAQQADALVTLGRSYLSGGSGERAGGSDAYQILVHVDRTALSEGTGRSDLPLETVKRLSCDAGIVNITDGPDGQPLSVGRKQRTAPVAIKRTLGATAAARSRLHSHPLRRCAPRWFTGRRRVREYDAPVRHHRLGTRAATRSAGRARSLVHSAV
jgi:hypothetical protein